MSVEINENGEIMAVGNTVIRNKNGSIITNEYGYQHGYVEDDNTNNNKIMLYEDYITVTEIIEY